jgi:hypothetical protein
MMTRAAKKPVNRIPYISSFSKVACLTVVVMIIAGCGFAGAGGSQPTVSVVASSTANPTASPTRAPTQTFTPQPTDTSTPTTVPTPAKLGAAVPYGSLEITLIGVATHDLIVPGGLYYYYPSDRTKIFLDLGVLVKNLTPGQPVGMKWKNLSVTEADGTISQPSFADVRTVDVGGKFDPFKIGIATQVSGEEAIAFDKYTYLRLIYIVAKKQAILFALEDSPAITFTLH